MNFEERLEKSRGEDIEMKDRTQLRMTIDTLKSTTITYENYRRVIDKILSFNSVIITQIESLKTQDDAVRRVYEEELKNHSRNMEDGIIPTKVYDLLLSRYKICLEMFNWKTGQAGLISILLDKTSSMFDDIKSLDIKRDALKEMKEMEEKRQQLFFDIMNSQASMFQKTITSQTDMFKEAVIEKFYMVDNKFFTFINMMEEKNRNEKRDLFNAFGNIVKELNFSDKEKQYELYAKTKSYGEKPVFTKEDKENITKSVAENEPEKKEVRVREEQEVTEQPKRGRPPVDRKKNDDIKKSFERVDLTDTEVDLDDY